MLAAEEAAGGPLDRGGPAEDPVHLERHALELLDEGQARLLVRKRAAGLGEG